MGTLYFRFIIKECGVSCARNAYSPHGVGLIRSKLKLGIMLSKAPEVKLTLDWHVMYGVF